MNRKSLGFAAATAALALSVGLTASPALAAVGDGTWGIWTATDVDDAPSGNITIGDSTVGGASFTFTANTGSTGYAYIESVNDKGEWLTAETPPGVVFGSNGPSDVENVITLDSSDPTNATFVITFDHAVPANELGVTIGDIDSANVSDPNESDRVLVEAKTGAGADLTSAELSGEVFNMCDVTVNADMPSDCGDTQDTHTPNMSTPTATSVKFSGDDTTSSDTGDYAWVHPTTDVKSVTLTWDSNDSGSSLRVFVAVTKHAALPDTGVDAVSVSLTSLVLGLLGAAALIAVRRRRA
jgi:LPXTG-motif cell wall-anchored protein